MIEVRHLHLDLGGFRLVDVSLELEDGCYFALLGPSGAGKSVLLETLVGLHRPGLGEVRIDGEDMVDVPPEERQIAYVPQDLALFPHMGVRDNILFGARARAVPENEQQRRLARAVALLRIDAVLDRRSIAGLSVGERQRVALARALMIEPRAIFLDEPFAAVDAYMTRTLQLELRRINRETGATVVQVTHDREEAYILGERIGVLIGGRLQQVGGRDDLYYRPATVDVARFLMTQNIFRGIVGTADAPDTVHLSGQGLELAAPLRAPAPAGSPVSFGIRPEEVMVLRPGEPLREPVRDNLTRGEIADRYQRGGCHTLLVQLGGDGPRIEVDIPNCAFRDLDLEVGQPVRLSLKKAAVWYLPQQPGSGADPPEWAG